MKPLIRSSLTLAAFALTALPLHATVTFLNGYSGTAAEVNTTTLLTYAGDVSNSDLLHGLTASPTGWNNTNNAHSSELHDGIHGVGFGVVSGDNVQGAWTTVGATASYNLGTGANGLGYDLTTITSIADWVNVGFGNQAWTLAVQLASGGGFVNVATVNYQPLGAGGGATKVALTGLNITGVEFLRVTANQVNDGVNAGAFVWRELDVAGVSTIPEPSSVLLLGLGGMALLRRRRPC